MQILFYTCHFNPTSVCQLHLLPSEPRKHLYKLPHIFFHSHISRIWKQWQSRIIWRTRTTAHCTVMDALPVSWPGTVALGWGGSALWIPTECSWPRPVCCLMSIEGGALCPFRCWRPRTGSLREFWRQASTWTRDLSLCGEKTQGQWPFLSSTS